MNTKDIEPAGDGAKLLKTEPGFTRGTWEVKESKVPGYERNIDVVAGNLLICEVTGGGVSNPVVLAEVRANARLLAASKALYEALKEILDPVDGPARAVPVGKFGVWERARAALALVDGSQTTEGDR